MKKIMEKGICVALIYLVAIGCTFILTSRIERLEQASIERSGASLSTK